jgi:hypothetical protein
VLPVSSASGRECEPKSGMACTKPVGRGYDPCSCVLPYPLNAARSASATDSPTLTPGRDAALLAGRAGGDAAVLRDPYADRGGACPARPCACPRTPPTIADATFGT